MAIFQVQEENEQKKLVPMTGGGPVDVVESGNDLSVTSNAVAESLSYSETETLTGGTWIDGKPIYRKVIDFGALPNTTTKSVAHNISNLGFVTKLYAMLHDTANSTDFIIPYASSNSSNIVNVARVGANINITTSANRTSQTAYVIIEYTKSS